MSLQSLVENAPILSGRRLAGVYTRWTLWYLLGMTVLWILGIEAIWSHATPFYALVLPAFSVIDVPLAVIATMILVREIGRRYLFPDSPRRWWKALSAGAGLALLAGIAFIAAVGRGRVDKTPLGEVLSADWAVVRWHLLALAVFTVSIVTLTIVLKKLRWFDAGLTRRAVAWMLAGIVAFSFVFSGAIAMLREGPKGISGAYSRYQYEYISDIGKGRTFQGLFHDYVKIHPYLSMHAKVHPPGPIVLLWILSWFAGQEALSLSIATMAFGALGILPLYWWTRDLTNTRVALTCCLVYAVMPSIVLFTATSADILFTPFTFLTLFWFGRAVERRSVRYSLAAGALYAVLALISFSLVSLGAYFGLVGIWKLRNKETRGAVVQTAFVMILAFVAVQGAVYAWSGFNIVECFRVSQEQFNRDQFEVDQAMPRYASWTWKVFNPLCWLYFAGIPVSVLFFSRLRHAAAGTRTLFVIFALTLVVLDFLYLARGEGERSAMYVFPFLALPAAHLLDDLGTRCQSLRPLATTLTFLAFQCWLTESYFYTYW
ncbi:MAG: glycosyltransferase family 39 protein [Candidatus Hydrogenedentes bacterium]|nr:glycosyltransferase family 39 protein [Candidatus Hydrogenedentota bacterium]